MVTDASEFRIGPRALDVVARAEYDALFDASTKLPKRALLYDRLLLSLARTRRTGTSVGVYFLRPDAPIADDAIARVAKLVSAELRVDDTVARTGPTEMVVVASLRDAQEARVVARRIAQALRSERAARAMTIGYACGTGADDPGELLVRAAGADATALREILTPFPPNLPQRLRATI